MDDQSPQVGMVTRKCQVAVEENVPDKDNPGVGRLVKVWKDARFHQFGTAISYADDRQVTITVAFVEMNGGRIYRVDPTEIRFVD